MHRQCWGARGGPCAGAGAIKASERPKVSHTAPTLLSARGTLASKCLADLSEIEALPLTCRVPARAPAPVVEVASCRSGFEVRR